MDVARQFGHGGWAGSGNSARFTDQGVPPPISLSSKGSKYFCGHFYTYSIGNESATPTADCVTQCFAVCINRMSIVGFKLYQGLHNICISSEDKKLLFQYFS